MTYQATAIKVMIASPSGLDDARRVAREVIAEWNDVHAEERRQVLMPVGWDTHAAPEIGGRPQAIINRQVLKGCDLLVALFWNRLGTPTGVADSGTVEEIEEHLRAGGIAMVYFSSAAVRIKDVDHAQYQALQKFKEEMKPRAIIEEFEDIEGFRKLFHRQLAQTVIRNWPPQPAAARAAQAAAAFSPDAKELLLEASRGDGIVLHINTLHSGPVVKANERVFTEPGNARVAARWQSAMKELISKRLLEPISKDALALTHPGYEAADFLERNPTART